MPRSALIFFLISLFYVLGLLLFGIIQSQPLDLRLNGPQLGWILGRQFEHTKRESMLASTLPSGRSHILTVILGREATNSLGLVLIDVLLCLLPYHIEVPT